MIIQQSEISKSALLMRDMLTEDLASVLSIERNAQVSPWARLSFEESLSRADSCRVMQVKNQIVAYHVCASVADELHVLNIVAAPSLQGRGLGHRLMDDIVGIAATLNLARIFLEVRSGNKIAQSLYQKWQFEQIGLRKKYYQASSSGSQVREDALVFVRQMNLN